MGHLRKLIGMKTSAAVWRPLAPAGAPAALELRPQAAPHLTGGARYGAPSANEV